MTRLHRQHRLALGLSLLLGLTATGRHALAGDGALYEAVAPKGSAFVRLYNAGNQEASASLGSVSLENVSPQTGSGFEYLPAGQYGARVDARNLPVNLVAEHYYTLVNQAGTAPLLVEEPAYKSKPSTARRRPSATTRTVVSVRGAGPDHARLRPKRTADEKTAGHDDVCVERRGDERRQAKRKHQEVGVRASSYGAGIDCHAHRLLQTHTS